MSLAEKFPRGFPETIDEGELVFVREATYSKDSKEMTPQGIMTALYNLIFYNSIDRQLFFGRDQDTDIVRVDYMEEEEFKGIVGVDTLKTAYCYLASRRNLDRTIRERCRVVIGSFVEFHYSIPEGDVWQTTVYRAPIARAAIYTATDLKQKAEWAFEKIDKLRRGEPISLD